MSYGCNRLISQGAGIIWDLDEFVGEIYRNSQYQIDLTFRKNDKRTCYEKSNASIAVKRMDELECKIYQCLDLQYISFDDILCKLNAKDVPQLLSTLSAMEYKGIIEHINGFYRIRDA